MVLLVTKVENGFGLGVHSRMCAISPDFLQIIISKADVQSGNTESTGNILASLTSTPAQALKWRERVDIAFEGYDHTTEELFEIPEVRDFVYKLDEMFPFWLFFMSKAHLGLQCILLCFLPPYLKPEAKARIFPVRIEQLLTQHLFPAMNDVCAFVGMSEEDVAEMTDRTIEYMSSGQTVTC